jgi:hypothetical protein
MLMAMACRERDVGARAGETTKTLTAAAMMARWFSFLFFREIRIAYDGNY